MELKEHLFLYFYEEKRIIRFNVSDLYYMRACKDYVIFNFNERSIKVHVTMKVVTNTNFNPVANK